VSGYQVGPETFLTLEVRVFDAEGEPASEPEILGVVFGMGGLLPGIDQALEGHLEGETVEVVLPAADAYGERKASAILEVDRAEFPDDVAVGDRFEVENEDGGILVVHILDVQDELVVMDTNHPLSDQEVKIQVQIREVRPATSEEISSAEAFLEEEISYSLAEVPDISPASLIRGGARG
jgi:FKBP-type peptidyl-prolyl cis-trans isomerase SlyD